MQKKQSPSTITDYFLDHAQDLIPEILDNNSQISILSPAQIDAAALIIKNNELTVYGLGANATNEQAILSIYEAKKRPLSDPIIVHVLGVEQAEQLVHLNEEERAVFKSLTSVFWPGPLTFIAKANLQKLPLVVTAGTGFVGLRSPRHPIARELIQKSGLPIGAPSANLFGHVSPTQSFHVVNDFYNQKISVIDGGRCSLGLESTVVKLSNGVLQVLREGSLTVSKLGEAIKAANLNIQLQIMKVTKKENENQESPGQMFRHYSPNIPCYYYQPPGDSSQESSSNKPLFELNESVFLSFSPVFDSFSGKAGHYFRVGESHNVQSEPTEDIQDKFCTAQERKIMQQVYYLLRKAENLGKKVIVVGWADEKKGAIWDKISRATENKQVRIENNSIIG